MTTRDEVLITDLPSRVMGGFTPARGLGRGWVAAPYAVAAFRGVGVGTGYDSGAPELTIRLDLVGSYVLYLGLGSGDSVRAWLDGETGFREFACEHGGWAFQEARLHAADLTGRCLHVAPVPASSYRHSDAHCYLGYIRAVPADHAPQQSARNLVATNDGFSWIALDGMAAVGDVTKQFQPYRDSDFFRMLWCPLGADVTGNHLTKVGTTTPFGVTHAYRRCDRQFALTTKKILKGGGDILKTAVAAAREVGLEIHFYIRPEAFFAPFPYDGVYTSKFLARHRRRRCRDEFGEEIMRLSYAYPAVQDHLLAYIEELLGYNPDGICFAFNRSLPMMICEPPVLQAYRERYGRRPRLPEENTAPEMLAVRHELLAGFIQRVHGLLAPRNLAFSCITELDHERNRTLGLDLGMLVDRGLVESICVAGAATDSEYYKELRATGQAKVYSSIHYTHAEGTAAPDPFDHRSQARALQAVLDSGLDGAFFWDTESMHRNPYNW
ncbi:hypothetical protein HQ590_06395, partial [bacterium]|nr:hypothetical protein [bacterium]